MNLERASLVSVTERSSATTSGAPRRRSPATRGGRPTLTRQRIAEVALDIAGQEGFRAVTMRRLAEELGVTVRALYRHVPDRQDVVDLAAALFLAQLPVAPAPDRDWRRRLRQFCHDGRALYRRYPRALTMPMDETITIDAVDLRRILSAEEKLEFLVSIGLTLTDAVAIRGQFLLDLFAFALLVDHLHAGSDATTARRMAAPVPAPWLDANPGLNVPYSRAAAELDLGTADEQFERVIEHLVAAIEHRLAHPTPDVTLGG